MDLVQLIFALMLGLHLSAQAEILPMQTMINQNTNEFIAVEIETGEFSNLRPGVFIMGVESGPQTSLAIQQVKSMGLSPLSLNGKVYGFKKGKGPRTVSFSNSTTIGIKIGGGCSSDSLCLGREVMYGLRMQLHPDSNLDFREKKGFSLEDPITKIIKAGSTLMNTVSIRDTVEDILQVNRVVAQNYQSENRRNWPRDLFPSLQVIRASKFKKETAATAEHIPAALKADLQDLEKEDLLNREKRTKPFIDAINENAPLWNSQAAQDYVQSWCDRIVVSSKLPANCRVFADLFPMAFSYPGGDVFINAGFIAAAQDESLLVFTLAHELAHIYSRHFSKTIAQKDFETRFFNTASLLSQMASLTSSRTFLAKQVYETVSRQSLSDVYASMMTNYTYDQETMADRIAYQITRSLGFSSAQLLNALNQHVQDIEYFYNDEQKSENRLNARYQKYTHRMDLIKEMARRDSAASQEPKASSPEFVSLKAELQNAYDFMRFSFMMN